MIALVGSLYSGIGGLDWAVEQAFGAATAWQLDQVGAAVRRRHWPDALQVEADVTSVDPDDLPRVDVLSGSFACQDLSCAGRGDGLIDGQRTGPTYRHLLRFAGARLLEDGDFEVDDRRKWLPEVVVMENVPALLSKWRAKLEEDWHRLGYGLTWVRARALDAGHPHRRARVFVLAVRGGHGRGVLDAPRDGEWTLARGERAWATLRASDARRGTDPDRDGRPGIVDQVRPWPTTTTRDAQASGAEGYSTESGRHSGTTLTDAVRPWPTVTTRDEKSGSGTNRSGPPPLSYEAPQYPSHPFGSRLSVDWAECLMGLPPGWTLPAGPRLEIDPDAPAVRGRYPADWDRSVYWPGFDWEPMRTIPDGPPVPGRPARTRAVGNAVAPHEGLLALRTALGATARQLMLLALVGCGEGTDDAGPQIEVIETSGPAEIRDVSGFQVLFCYEVEGVERCRDETAEFTLLDGTITLEGRAPNWWRVSVW